MAPRTSVFQASSPPPFNSPQRSGFGAHLFAASGCLICHTYAGAGTRNLGARDLTRVGRRRRARWIERYVANPRTFGDQVMPVFGNAFSSRQVGELAAFLAASKGAA